MFERTRTSVGVWQSLLFVAVAVGVAGCCNGPEPVDVVVTVMDEEIKRSAGSAPYQIDIVAVTESELSELKNKTQEDYWNRGGSAGIEAAGRLKQFIAPRGEAILLASDKKFWDAAERRWDLNDEVMYIGVVADLPTTASLDKQQWYRFTQCTHKALDADSEVKFEVRDHASREKPGVSGPIIVDPKQRSKRSVERPSQSQ